MVEDMAAYSHEEFRPGRPAVIFPISTGKAKTTRSGLKKNTRRHTEETVTRSGRNRLKRCFRPPGGIVDVITDRQSEQERAAAARAAERTGQRRAKIALLRRPGGIAEADEPHRMFGRRGVAGRGQRRAPVRQRS
jgi:hypothetical protein